MQPWWRRWRRVRKPKSDPLLGPIEQGLLNENHKLWESLPAMGFVSTFEYYDVKQGYATPS